MPHSSRIRLSLLALLALVAAAPVRAQEPEPPARDQEPPAPEPVTQESTAPPVPGHAPPRFALSVSVGRLGDRALQSQTVIAARRDAAGTVLETTTLTRGLDAEGGVEVGLAGLMSLGRVWALRLGAGIGRTSFDVDYSGEDEIFVAAASHLAAGEETEVTVVSVEGALRMRLASSRRAQPYLELGAASMHWTSSTPLPGAASLSDGVHRLAGTAAVGMIVPVRDRLSAQIHGSVRTYRTPLDPAAVDTEGPASSTLAITFADPETAPFADPALELTTAFRLDLGIRMAFGVSRAADQAPATRPEPAPPAVP